MRLRSVAGNSQRLDGGAMFGNAPRALWSRWWPPDPHNRIPLACRSLLVTEDSGRTILFETGIGAFFEPALRERYGVQQDEHVLLQSLRALGVRPEDVDVIVLSHLHFDHAGGLLTAWQPGVPPSLAFPRARVLVGREAWARAVRPHVRDRASFIPELVPLLEHSGRLELVTGDRSPSLGPRFRFELTHGHTPGLLHARIETPRGPIRFMSDLVPGAAWLHLPITMGYDRFPELVIEEKDAMLHRILAEDGWMFFTHDARIAAAKVEQDEDGRFGMGASLETLAWG